MFSLIGWPIESDGEPHKTWQREYWSTLEPFTDGYYMNETADEGQEAVNENYRGNYKRLVQIKKRYDPTNLFRLNANVRPA